MFFFLLSAAISAAEVLETPNPTPSPFKTFNYQKISITVSIVYGILAIAAATSLILVNVRHRDE